MQKNEILELVKGYREKIRQLPFERLKVTFELLTPIAFSEFLAFDGMLSYCVMKRLLGENFFQVQGSSVDQLVDVPLPIEERGKKLKYYACSFAQYKKSQEAVGSWKKRWDENYDWLVKFEKKEKVINVGGKFKAGNMPIVYVSVPTIWFYVIGNKEEIENLLAEVQYIGKGKAQGYGKIKSIQVEKFDFEDSQMVRPIPIEELGEDWQGERQWMTYKNPYWNPANFVECGI